jgi:8-oxo-dGTP pyrophosphatase MutT (NUDIX family)
MKASKNDHFYSFVKGKIEKNETKKECCQREVEEEIGVKISSYDLEYSVKQKNRKKDIILFYINWDKYIDCPFILEEKEVYEVKWFNIKRMPSISKNQRLILTDIKVRFDKLNFITKGVKKCLMKSK